MDGSVRFVKNTVSLPTWWALGTRNGGEVVSADAYSNRRQRAGSEEHHAQPCSEPLDLESGPIRRCPMIPTHSRSTRVLAARGNGRVPGRLPCELPGMLGQAGIRQGRRAHPESLLQEFVLRYKRLPDQATAKQKAQAARIAKVQAASRPRRPFRQVAAEGGRDETQRTPEDRDPGPPDRHPGTRLGQLQGIGASDAAKKAIEQIRKETSIKENDRQAVIDRVGKLQ